MNGCACATRAWSIYIDNFDLWEVFDAPVAERLVGSKHLECHGRDREVLRRLELARES